MNNLNLEFVKFEFNFGYLFYWFESDLVIDLFCYVLAKTIGQRDIV